MADTTAIQAKLHALRAQYLASLPDRLAALRQAIDRLGYAPADAEMLRQARQIAHGLTGSGASFGFAKISETARLLEQLLDSVAGQDPPDESAHERIRHACNALEAACTLPGSRQE